MKRIYLITAILISLAGQTIKAQVPQLWGLTYNCGANNCGSIIKINEDGSGFLETMYSFDTITGINPTGSLLKASDGKLYGLLEFGGTDTVHHSGIFFAPGSGVLFSFDPVYHVYTLLYNFDFNHGAYPTGSVIELSNGKLYGTANWRGADTSGVLFCFDLVTHIYTDLHDYNNITTGSNPSPSLLMASNGKLYGTTDQGGDTLLNRFGEGTLFSFDPSTNMYADLFNFILLTGNHPRGNLIQATNGKLYGVTGSGGDTVSNSLGRGVIFSFDPSTNIYTDLYHDTANSFSSLIQATNGKLYGTNFTGEIFSYDISTNTWTIIHNFSYAIQNSLIQGSNSKLYGTDLFTVFSTDTLGNNSTTVYNFNSFCPSVTTYGALIELPFNTGLLEKQKQNNEISIYPNPAKSCINIQLPSLDQNETLQITDVLGRKIYQQTLSEINTTIDVSKWNEGVYFYEIISNKEIARGKFVIQK